MFPETKNIDYKSAGKAPALDVPPDLVQPDIDERYSIPEQSSPGSATFSSYSNEPVSYTHLDVYKRQGYAQS